MSEEKQPQPKPSLTPQEQEQQEQEAQIHGQFAATDMVERANDIFESFGFGPGGSIFGKTAFDGRKLNEMLDFLESANPEALEDAGDALERATKAINDAAKDLNDFVKQTKAEWHGEGAEAFQTYGSEVVGYAWGIGKFANAVGAQMKVASTGLASVRNARPPRDNRAVQKDPKDFKVPEQSPDNPEYQKALQVERDRQEAINQMNRLASFYAVSHGTLAAQEPPKPPAAYKAAVPPPSESIMPVADAGSGASRGDLSQSSTGRASVYEVRTSETSSMPEALGRAEPIRDPNTSMEIDSVKTPPPPTATTNPTPTPTATGTPNPNNGPVPPMMGDFRTPIRTAAPRATGQPGIPRAGGTTVNPHATGKPGTAGGNPPAGRTAGPMGRPTGTPGGGPATSSGRSPVVGRPSMTGPAGATGGPGPAGGRGQSPVVGRPAITGQPVTGRSGGPNSPRGGRTDGIIGGTPQRSAGGNTGSRIPKGSVIGAEGPAVGRSSAARPSQSGVVGANSADRAARPVSRGTPSANGVVGTPRATGSRPGAAAFSGRGNQRQPDDDDQSRDGSTRPDYLTEDEETWANRRRGPVPPVID